MKIINPATEEIIKELSEDTKQTAGEKFYHLKKAQASWQNTTLEHRIHLLQNFSTLLEKNIEALASVLTSEVGKPLQQSRNEVNGARTRIKWLTENAVKY